MSIFSDETQQKIRSCIDNSYKGIRILCGDFILEKSLYESLGLSKFDTSTSRIIH